MNAAINKDAMVRSTFWSALDFLLVKVVGFATVIFLARILTPSDFGVVALGAVFIAIATGFAEGGLGHALIQSEDISASDMSTVFWLNVGLATVASLAILAGASSIAGFFDQPVLEPLLQIMAVIVMLGALGAVQRSLLMRDLAYKKLAIVRVAATVISGVAAIALALYGFGVFALAAQACLLTLVSTVLYWTFSAWRPSLVFHREAATRLFSFGGFLFASTLLELVYSRLYLLLVGKFNSASLVGLFGRADATILLVQGVVTHPLGQVAFPTMSRLQGDRERLREALSSGLKVSMLINVSVMLGLGAVAQPFVQVVYGDQWTEMVPYLQILCLGGALMPIHILNLHVIMALGHAKVFFYLDVWKKVAGIAIVLVSMAWGPIGIAWGMVCAALVAVFINMSQSNRLLGYLPAQQFLDMAPAALLGAAVAACAFATVHLLQQVNAHPALVLLAAIMAGGAVWAGIALTLDMAGIRHLSAIVSGKGLAKLGIQPRSHEHGRDAP